LPDAARRVRAALVALLVLLSAYLVFGPHPWDPGWAERLAAGKPLRAKDYADRFEWWACLANALLLAGLLATRRLWLRLGEPPALEALAPPPRPTQSRIGLVVLAALLLGAAAWPRLGFGLWDDEERTARNAVAGFYLVEDGTLRFHDAGWRDTLWQYDPNNHVAYSVAARLVSSTWRALTGSADQRAPEAAMRLPALAFGLASVASAFLLLWRLGFAGAGVLAAWLLALHPWQIRYASEARGYSLLMGLATGSVVLLIRALHRGRWRDWALFAAAELVMLWTFPPAIVYVALTNLAAAVLLLRLRGGTPDASSQLTRWLIAGLGAAMLLLQLMLPDLPQLAAYLGEQHRRLDLRFLQSVLSDLFAGQPWTWYPHGGPQFPELAHLATHHPLGFRAAGAATVLGLALGIWRLLRAPSPGPALVPVLTLGAPLSMGIAWLRGDELYAWHLSYLLPPLVCLTALGIQWPAERLGRLRGAAARLAPAIPLAYLAAFAAWTAEPRSALRDRPFEPMRESVAATRPLAPGAPGQADVLTASFSGEPFYYDPFVHRIRRVEQLETLLHESDASGRPLFVNIGRIALAERRSPKLLALVRRTDLFEEVARFDGLEPKHRRYVYRHVPRSEHATSPPAPRVDGSDGPD
jgi:hypothetical protein